MPRPAKAQLATPPGYRIQRKPSGNHQAFCEVRGRRIYLGRHGTPESLQRFYAVMAEVQANGGHLPVATDELTVVELVARWLDYAERYYRNSTAPQEATYALRLLNRLYGNTPAAEFGPRSLDALRAWWIAGRHREAPPEPDAPTTTRVHTTPLSRRAIAKYTTQVRQIFKWGVAQELVPAEVHQALTTLAVCPPAVPPPARVRRGRWCPTT